MSRYRINVLKDRKSLYVYKRSIYHFIQECVDNKVVYAEYKPTTELEADLFTKALQSSFF